MKPLAQNSMIQNRYLVVQMIGKGGMGEVYLAVDQRLGSAVALKRTMFKENDGLATAFEREAKILGRLRHPVLPKVIDHFIEGNDQYLVMEHITGEDLGKRLEAAGKPFPLSWVLFWCDQLLDALNYMHSHEPPIIHRDIKPENLKLTDDNHIVLLDFGLSKDFDSRSDTASLGTGSVVGYSPYFASMEQMRGAGTDARSDLYSFSATVYQLLTNTMPADSLTRADAMLGGEPDPVQPVSIINSEVPPAVSDVILKGMSVRQDERFTSATEMQKALRRAFNGAEVPAADKSEAQTRMMAVPAEIASGPSTPQAAPSPGFSNEPTIASGSDAQTQIIPQVPTLAPEENGDKTDAGADLGATAIMPEVTQDLGEVDTDASIRQADVRTQMMPLPVEDATSVEEAPQPVEALHPGASPVAHPEYPASPPQRSRSGRGLIFGLLALLILAGIAAGGGWFAYNKYYLPSQVQASSTPEAPTPAPATPAPAASPALAAETSPSPEPTTSTSDSNTKAADRDPAAVTETRPNQPATKAPPKAASTPPSAKQPPKAKSPGDRTVILQ